MNHFPTIQIQVPVCLSVALPEPIKDEWLPGSHIISATGDFGFVSTQNILIEGINAYYVVAETHQELQLRVTDTISVLFLIIQLKGSYEIISRNGHSKSGRQNAFALMFTADPSIGVKLPKQEKIKSLVLAYPVSQILSLLSFYPSLSEWTENIQTLTNFTSAERTLSASLSEKVYGLLHTPFVPLTQEYYLHTCKEIIEQIFNESLEKGNINVPFDLHDIGCIHEAKQYLDTHILEHPTIAQLSRKAGINSLKLKKGFKELYGIGVYGYQLQQRMLIAKSALEKTRKPIHHIAQQAGYKNTSNFSAAFKRVYGASPYKYRHSPTPSV